MEITEIWMKAMYSGRQQPEYWFMTGASLRQAAELLFLQVEARHPDGEPINIEDFQMQLEKPAMLLLGLAFENAVKGHLLERGILSWDQASKNGPWKRHDLTRLYEMTNFGLADEQRWLLTQLSAFTVWAGKYPLCFKPEDFTLAADHVRERAPKLLPTSFQPSERAKIDEMIVPLQSR